jgi:cation:H+ antiporter
MAYWFLGAGFVLLAVGSDAVVRGGIATARWLGIAPLAIGIFSIAAAGSAPELVVSLQGNLGGAPDIALGNVVGSNTVNLLVGLGLAALIRPLTSTPKVVLRDGGSMLAASLVLTLLSWEQVISRAEAVLLVTGLAGYLTALFLSDRRGPAKQSIPIATARSQVASNKTSGLAGSVIVLFGLACLVFGAHFTVAGAVTLAATLRLTQAHVGLVLVALATSLPQLYLIAAAAARGQTDLAIGSLIGANTINIVGVVGLTALIRPLAVAPTLASSDVLVMFGAAAILLPMLARKWRLSRLQGALLLACYAGYMTFVALR